MPSLVIRPASIIDITEIVKVRTETLTDKEISGFSAPGDNIYSSKEKLAELWDADNKLKDNSEIFVAVFEGTIRGFIVFNRDNYADNIDNIIVDKNDQGKGIGRTLVNYLEDLAKSLGMTVITTDTIENARGIPWKACGF